MNLGAVAAIIRRDYLVTRSYRLAFVLDAVYGLLGLAIYFFISRTFENVGAAGLGAAPSYFAFAAVGVAIGAIIDAAATGLARRLREEQLTGTLEALVVQPLTPVEMAVGLAGFPISFALARSLVYLAMAAWWVDLDLGEVQWIGLVLMLPASAAALATIGILSGALVLVLKRGEVTVAAFVLAMTFLSGALFPISALPSWAEATGRVLPLRFAFDGVRAALFGGNGWPDDVLALLLFTLVSLPACFAVFGLALRQARRSGTVGQY